VVDGRSSWYQVRSVSTFGYPSIEHHSPIYCHFQMLTVSGRYICVCSDVTLVIVTKRLMAASRKILLCVG
jgi:hypothetical protein